MRIAVMLLCGLSGAMLASCASYEWRHESKRANLVDAQLLKCEEKALDLYPTLITQDVSGGRSKGGSSKCAAARSGSKAAAECVSTGGKSYGASTYSRDMNRSDRNRATERCMRANGWRKIKVE